MIQVDFLNPLAPLLKMNIVQVILNGSMNSEINGLLKKIKLAIFLIENMFIVKVIQRVAAKEAQEYSKAGSVAEEVLSAIRIVAAFSGEKKELTR